MVRRPAHSENGIPPERWTELASTAKRIRTDGGTVQEAVVDAIKKGIVRGVLSPGARLLQLEIAHRLEVSHTPVREALRALEKDGLVRSERHRGFSVVELDSDAIDEIYQLRTLLECHAIRLAIPLLNDKDLDDLHAIRLEIEASTDPIQQQDLRERFLGRLFAVTALPRLIAAIDRLQNEVGRLMHLLPRRHSAQMHVRILDAIEREDADEATRLLTEHYTEIIRLFRRFGRQRAARSDEARIVAQRARATSRAGAGSGVRRRC